MHAYLRSRLQTSLKVFWQLIKIMVPVMLVVKIAAELGLIDALGPLLAPVMALLGLPPEAGLVLVAPLPSASMAGWAPCRCWQSPR